MRTRQTPGGVVGGGGGGGGDTYFICYLGGVQINDPGPTLFPLRQILDKTLEQEMQYITVQHPHPSLRGGGVSEYILKCVIRRNRLVHTCTHTLDKVREQEF